MADFPYPYFQVQFTKEGLVFQQPEVDALLNSLTDNTHRPSDLFVMCHGWNNNMDDATALYAGLAARIKGQIDHNPSLSSRSYAICGVLWPSKKFDDQDLIPSGAAALNDAVTVDQLKQRLDDLKSLYSASGWPSGQNVAPAAF